MVNMLETEKDSLANSVPLADKAAKLDNLLVKCSELEDNMQRIWEDATIEGVNNIKKFVKIKKQADKTPVTLKYTEEYQKMRRNVKNLIHKRFLQQEAHNKAVESLIEQAIAPTESSASPRVLFSFESFKKIPEFKLLHKHKRKFGESWIGKDNRLNKSVEHNNTPSRARDFANFASPQPLIQAKSEREDSYPDFTNINERSSGVYINKSVNLGRNSTYKTPKRSITIHNSAPVSSIKKSYKQNSLTIQSSPDYDFEHIHVERFKLPSIRGLKEPKQLVLDDSHIKELFDESFDDQQKLRIEKLISKSHINEQKRKGLGRIPAKSKTRKTTNY
jgi:hypothetical protein